MLSMDLFYISLTVADPREEYSRKLYTSGNLTKTFRRIYL